MKLLTPSHMSTDLNEKCVKNQLSNLFNCINKFIKVKKKELN